MGPPFRLKGPYITSARYSSGDERSASDPQCPKCHALYWEASILFEPPNSLSSHISNQISATTPFHRLAHHGAQRGSIRKVQLRKSSALIQGLASLGLRVYRVQGLGFRV